MIALNNLTKGLYLYLLCGIMIAVYMTIIYMLSHSLMPDKAKGSLIYDDAGNLRGSILLAQHYKGDRYFKGRLNSKTNKCDVAMYSEAFRKEINSRYKGSLYKGDVIMITSSHSLLDPYISKKDALRQAQLVAEARGVGLEDVVSLVEELTLHSLYPFFQLDIVNVTELNAMLD